MQIFTLDSFFVLMLAIAIFGMIPILKKYCKRRYLMMIFHKGVESKATLLGFEQIGPTESVSHRTLRLKLQVNRENDRNFVTEVEQKLNLIDLQDLKIGSKVRVKYDPRKPKQVLLISETDKRPGFN